MNIKRTRHVFQTNPEVVNQDIVTTGIEATVDDKGTIQNVVETVNGDKFLDTYAATPLPSYGGEQNTPENQPDEHIRNSKERDIVNNKLSFLDRKLTATRKTITALDSYHIIGDAKTSTDVYAFINSLLPNTSFIINTPNTVSYALNDTNYQFKKGDLIYKGLDNNLIYIPALASGYYYPSALSTIDQGNTYKLTYSFTSNPPIEDKKEHFIGSNPYKDMYGQFEYKEENLAYNYRQALSPKSTAEIDSCKKSKKDTEGSIIYESIEPIVYYYYDNERIMFDKDFEITKESKVQLENFSSLTVDVEVR